MTTDTYEIVPARARKRPVVKRKRKTCTRSQLIRKTDKLASKYIRQLYADDDGMVFCFTCPYKAHWKGMQNGHYITRSRYWVRWMVENLRPQCFVCNMRNAGMSHVFRENLVKEYGEAAVKWVEDISKKENKDFTGDMIQERKYFFELALKMYES